MPFWPRGEACDLHLRRERRAACPEGTTSWGESLAAASDSQRRSGGGASIVARSVREALFHHDINLVGFFDQLSSRPVSHSGLTKPRLEHRPDLYESATPGLNSLVKLRVEQPVFNATGTRSRCAAQPSSFLFGSSSGRLRDNIRSGAL